MPLSLRTRAIPSRGVLLLLVGLLVVLGTLQYRWSGELSEAERVRLRAGAQERAESFARDFDREVTRVFLRLGHAGGAGPTDGLETYAEQLDRWRQATAHPGLVADVFLAESDGRLRRFRDRAFVESPWPVAWRPLRERLSSASGGPSAGTFAMGSFSVAGSAGTMFRGRDDRPGPFTFLPDGTPALVLPVLRTVRSEAAPGLATSTRFAPLASLVVVLDLAYVRDRLLPALATRHFGGADGLEYALAIARGDEPGPLVWQSAPTVPGGTPDAAAGLLELRPEDADEGDLREMLRPRDAVWAGPRPGDGRGPPIDSLSKPLDGARERSVRVGKRGRWQLSATHRAGSLDAAVAATRRRNLTVGFGILILLGASAALLVSSARRAERLARRQIEFVAGVTHELRTPLAVIRSAGENLADGVIDEPPDVRRYGELVRDEGRRLTTMVEEALELAGAESGRMAATREPVAVGQLLDDTLREWRAQSEGQGVQAHADVAADLPPVLGDEAALRRALRNLLDNAVKHGGEAPWVGVRAESRGARVAVTVEDRGPGIPASEREQVFEPFYRGRDARARRVRGTGLGLSLVRGIVESHGGDVRIGESSTGGALFTVTLPALTGGG